MFISFVATSTCIIVYRCGDYVENIQKMGRGIKVQYVCNADGGSLPRVPVVRSYTTLEMILFWAFGTLVPKSHVAFLPLFYMYTKIDNEYVALHKH